MYKLEFNLKQHTPLIHFQHDQAGATLRATEVKPKLDQFIFEKITGKKGFDARLAFHHLMFHGDQNGESRISWLSGKGRELKEHYLSNNERNGALIHLSFDYKLRVEMVVPEFKIIERGFKFPCFFGDMGDDYEGNEKGFSLVNSVIQCEIHTKNKSLKDFIAGSLLDFFSLTNFGTRQSKGFGSFYLDSQSPFLAEYNLEFKVPNLKFSFEITIPKNSVWNQYHYLFNVINLFYKSLRQGINEKGRPSYTPVSGTPKIMKVSRNDKFYLKPLIFLYAKNAFGKQWDKKTIKATYLNINVIDRKPDRSECRDLGLNLREDKIRENGLPSQIADYPDSDILNYSQLNQTENEFYDFKDVFGLSSLEAWKSYGAKISKENGELARFKSPIIFKPYLVSGTTYRIYFDFTELPDEYSGKSFIVKINATGSLSLIIPSFFKWTDFFDFILNRRNFNIEEYIAPKYKTFEKPEKWLNENIYNINYYQILKSIYQQLQK